MNDDFFDHLAQAVRHTVLAAVALVPPQARPHLAAIAREGVALLNSLADPTPRRRTPPSGPAASTSRSEPCV
ncbi:MAG: hypothetical protein HZY73_15375 [Micropruina sp.]|nr:MAG: hypothetical protein HZY73_15375 [Micropruina sp.]